MQLGDPITDPLIIKSLEGGAAAAAPVDPATASALDQQGSYSGTILPFTKDAQGNVSFDSNAGVVGMGKRLLSSIGSGVSAPADAYNGQLPAFTPGGQWNPEMVNRAADTASLLASPSPASVGSFAVRAKPSVPSAGELKAAASAGYDTARDSGLELSADSVANMAQGLQADLQREGFVAKVAPKTHGILDDIANPPSGSTASIADIESMRRAFSKVSGDATDEAAAGRAVRTIDGFLSSIDPSSVVAGAAAPEGVAATLRDARGNYGAAMRSNALTGELDNANTGILERAEARAEASHSGRNLDNSIRQRVATLLQNPGNLAGFSQPEIDALKAVVAGGPVQNTLRFVGNTLGAGGGLGHMIAGGAGAALGAAHGGVEGGAIGAMIPTVVGSTAKGVENMLARRSLGNADKTVRMNSPLYQGLLAQQPYTLPLTAGQAAIRSALPGLLAPPAPPPPTDGLLGQYFRAGGA